MADNKHNVSYNEVRQLYCEARQLEQLAWSVANDYVAHMYAKGIKNGVNIKIIKLWFDDDETFVFEWGIVNPDKPDGYITDRDQVDLPISALVDLEEFLEKYTNPQRNYK